jgi:hypothetical protein
MACGMTINRSWNAMFPTNSNIQGVMKMADFIHMNELSCTMEDLKNTITSNLSDSRLAKFYTDLIDGFIRFCQDEENSTINWKLSVVLPQRAILITVLLYHILQF